jgi:hypothetical protein
MSDTAQSVPTLQPRQASPVFDASVSGGWVPHSFGWNLDGGRRQDAGANLTPPTATFA